MIPINDLARDGVPVDNSATERAVVNDVLRRGMFFAGPATEQFEHEFAEFVGVSACTGVGSGTDALTLALAAVGVGPGDKVATVANAGFYSSVACHRLGAVPVYIDVDPRSACMDPEQLAEVLDGSFSAVVVTHLYGHVADLTAHRSLCDRWSVPLVEDCAQAVGGRRNGRGAGAVGTVGCFSFYPTKNLGAVGDAGAVVSDDADILRRVRAMAQYGWSEKYVVTHAGGMNSRLDEVQAAVLLARLPALDAVNGVRRRIAERIREVADAHACHMFFDDTEAHVAHLAVLAVADRENVRSELAAFGVATEVHYPVPDYRQPVMMDTGHRYVGLPVTESLAASVLTVPCFPTLRPEEIQHLLMSLEAVLTDGRSMTFG